MFGLIGCWFGWHPYRGRMMRSDHGRKRTASAVATWTCGYCLRALPDASKTRIVLDVRLLRTLRAQVPAAREKSKIVRLSVVRKDDVA